MTQQRSDILADPPDPGMLRICRRCRRWFALRLQSKQPDAKAGTLRIYRCKYCGAKTIYADHHPRDAT